MQGDMDKELPSINENEAELNDYYFKTTSYKPSSVYLSVKANFINKEQIDVIQAKCNYLDIWTYKDSKLEKQFDIPLPGQIANLTTLRSKNYETDLLFVLLVDGEYFTIVYDFPTYGIKTLDCGKVETNVEHPLPNGVVTAVDANSRVLAFSTYPGNIKFLLLDLFNAGNSSNNDTNIPTSSSGKLNVDESTTVQRFSVPINNILSLTFLPFNFPISVLPSSSIAILAILHASPRYDYNIITLYEYDFEVDSLQRLKLETFINLFGLNNDISGNLEIPDLKVNFSIQAIKSLPNGIIVGVGDGHMTHFDPLKLLLERLKPLSKNIKSLLSKYEREKQVKLNSENDLRAFHKRAANSTQFKHNVNISDSTGDFDNDKYFSTFNEKASKAVRLDNFGDNLDLTFEANDGVEVISPPIADSLNENSNKVETGLTNELKSMVDVPRIHEPKLSQITCFTHLETDYSSLVRLVVGTASGRVMVVDYKETYGDKMEVRMVLDNRSIPTNIIALPNNHIYLTSHFSNHEMLHLKQDGTTTTPTEVQTFPTLSPIMDMFTLQHGSDASGRRYDEVVIGAGGFQCGRVHVIRSGAKYNYNQVLELPDVLNLFGFALQGRRFLAASFVNSTKLLEFPDPSSGLEYVTEIQINGFNTETDTESLLVASFEGMLVQVTPQQVVVIVVDEDKIIRWVPESNDALEHIDITVASRLTKLGTLAVACQNYIYLLQISTQKGIEIINKQSFEDEVSAIDIVDASNSDKLGLLAVSYWNSYQIQLFTTPELQLLTTIQTHDDVTVNSILFHKVNTQLHLLTATSDGHITYWSINTTTHELGPSDYLAPGTRPSQLVPHSDGESIIVVCDRPAILHPNSNKDEKGLSYTFINAKDPTNAATFLPSNSADPGLAVFADKDVVIFGILEISRSLATQTTTLGKFPRVMLPHPSLPILTALTTTAPPHPDICGSQSNVRNETSELVVLTQPDMAALASYKFPNDEIALSLQTYKFNGFGDIDLLVVGTGKLSVHRDSNLNRGYLYRFFIDPKTYALKQLERTEITTPPQFIKVLPAPKDTILVASNSRLSLYFHDAKEFKLVYSEHIYTTTHIGSLDVQPCTTNANDGTFQIILGDLVANTSVFKYYYRVLSRDKLKHNFKLVATDRQSKWVAKVHTMTKDRYLVADCNGSLSVIKAADSNVEGDPAHQLVKVATTSVHDLVNATVEGSIAIPPLVSFQKGTNLPLLSTVKLHSSNNGVTYQPTMLATTSGTIITINPLPKAVFSILKQLITNLQHFLGKLGTTHLNQHFEDSKNLNFVDLDTALQFLELDASLQDSVLEGSSNSFKPKNTFFIPQTANVCFDTRMEIEQLEGGSKWTDTEAETGTDVGLKPKKIGVVKFKVVKLLNDLNRVN